MLSDVHVARVIMLNDGPVEVFVGDANMAEARKQRLRDEYAEKNKHVLGADRTAGLCWHIREVPLLVTGAMVSSVASVCVKCGGSGVVVREDLNGRDECAACRGTGWAG